MLIKKMFPSLGPRGPTPTALSHTVVCLHVSHPLSLFHSHHPYSCSLQSSRRVAAHKPLNQPLLLSEVR